MRIPPIPDLSLAGGVGFLIDFQGDSFEEQVVFGVREHDGNAFVLTDSPDGQWGLLRLEVRDRAGRALLAEISTSGTHGRRLACGVVPEDNLVRAFELQPWAPADTLDITIGQGDGPREFRAFAQPLFVSGCNVDGQRQGSFIGRTAEFALFDTPLEDHEIAELRAASKERDDADLPEHDPSALDEEGRKLFLDDYDTLREWQQKGSLERRDTRNASVVAFRWLCDRRPLLRRLSDCYGVLLSLPDLDALRSETEKIASGRAEAPPFYYPQERWEGNWLPLSGFLGDMAFWVGGDHLVSWEAFVKFVRHKLGGGHWDPDERARWQRELQAMDEASGEAWINAKMFALVRSLIFTVESCGLVALARPAVP